MELGGGLECPREVLARRARRVERQGLLTGAPSVFEGSRPEPRRVIVLGELSQVRLTFLRVGLLHRLGDPLVQQTPLAGKELGQDRLAGERVPESQLLG